MAVTADSCLALLEELPVLAVVKRELRRFGSRPGSAAMMALAVLDHSATDAGGEPLRLTTLAEKLQVDLSVASRQVASLIELGAVERVLDRNDGRARLLRVTATGQQMLQQARQAVADGIAVQLAHWQEPDLITLVQLLGRLRSDLGAGAGQVRAERPDDHTAPTPANADPPPAGTDPARAQQAPSPRAPSHPAPPHQAPSHLSRPGRTAQVTAVPPSDTGVALS